jgi:LEA14-like dessication related protein
MFTNHKTPIMRLLIYFLVLFGAIGCKTGEAPVYKTYQNFQLQKLSLDTSVVQTELVFFNPNDFAAKLKRANGQVYIENIFAGNFALDSLIQIPAKGNFVVPVRFKMGMKDFMKNALSLLFKSELEFWVKGMARVGRGLFAKNIPIDFKTMQAIKF